MVNDFCFLLSNGLFISDKRTFDNNLSFSPCCIFNDEVKNLSDAKWNDIKDWTPSCNRCLLKEKNNKKSSRQDYQSWFSDIKEEGLTFLEIDYSNACNAACGMCKPFNSSLIEKMWREEGVNLITAPNVKRKDFYEAIDNLDLSKVKVLKFRGGEPLYSNFHEVLLEKISLPEVATVFYQTNGSIYPSDKWWNLAKNFKKIHFSFSIDAVGERFNYIRSPLKFTEVENNIIRLMKSKEINGVFSIECTINPLNAYYYDEVFEFYKKLRLINKNITLNWHNCWGDLWALNNTPPSLRKLITEKYKNNSMCRVINDFNFKEDEFISFVLNIKKHEKRFNFDTDKIFPEIYPLIQEYYETLIV
jgi:hypothetical protein